jgi:hypothetical protein
MKTISINEITLPLPDGWEIPPAGRSYQGKEGILDVRIKDRGVPVNDERLRLAKEEFSARGASVSLIVVQNVNCLFCTYLERNCTFRTYSFDTGMDREVVAVYVFRPGHHALAEVIHQTILSPSAAR